MAKTSWLMWMAGVAIVLPFVGCSGGSGAARQTQSLRPENFLRPTIESSPSQDSNHPNMVDRAGPIAYDNVSVDLLAQPNEQHRSTGESIRSISPEVANAFPDANEPAETKTDPTASPGNATAVQHVSAANAAKKPSLTTGGQMQLGSVVTEVNGTPIYADKVLSVLDKVFRAEAAQRDPASFRKFAEGAIRNQVNAMLSNELEYAAALKESDGKDKQVAEAATMEWRRRKITEAGGSVEQARRRLADGYDFDDQAKDEYRSNLVRIYYQKKLLPRVQVNADDMRRYYDQNLNTKFTEQAKAQFRVIKIDIRKTGDKKLAQDKANDLRSRAVSGEDFAKLASDFNDDSFLKSRGGDVGWMDKNAYANEPLEQAVWLTDVGGVTEVIEFRDAFWFAKVEAKKPGNTQPFESQTVQDAIRETLRRQQLLALRDQNRDRLVASAIINPDPPLFGPAVDMAMQRYAELRSSASVR